VPSEKEKDRRDRGESVREEMMRRREGERERVCVCVCFVVKEPPNGKPK